MAGGHNSTLVLLNEPLVRAREGPPKTHVTSRAIGRCKFAAESVPTCVLIFVSCGHPGRVRRAGWPQAFMCRDRIQRYSGVRQCYQFRQCVVRSPTSPASCMSPTRISASGRFRTGRRSGSARTGGGFRLGMLGCAWDRGLERFGGEASSSGPGRSGGLRDRAIVAAREPWGVACASPPSVQSGGAPDRARLAGGEPRTLAH